MGAPQEEFDSTPGGMLQSAKGGDILTSRIPLLVTDDSCIAD
jgi:hypothetical protein